MVGFEIRFEDSNAFCTQKVPDQTLVSLQNFYLTDVALVFCAMF